MRWTCGTSPHVFSNFKIHGSIGSSGGSSSPGSSGNKGQGALIGGLVGTAVALVVISVALVLFVRQRQQAKQQEGTMLEPFLTVEG
mmetsp:Transcript_21840/g.51997  ORF Transcript_21840/g.51997 Transcript_21840/m.51997 type:complete len:86 (-) Transcript_21840:73-330(-)